MSDTISIKELLKGVEVDLKPLGDVIELKKGKQLNKELLSENGLYPAYNGGVSYSGFTDNYNYDENTIIISQGGASAGFVNFVTIKFYANAHCYVVLPKTEIAKNRYVYHFLKLNQEKLTNKQHGAGIPALRTREILDIKIPIPPLKVQSEIVKILDNFTELTARKKQYSYYRDTLLSFQGNFADACFKDDKVEWKKLGEVADINTGQKPHNIIDTVTDFEYINAGTTNSGYTEKSNCDGDVTTTPSRGQGGIGYVGFQPKSFWLGPLCYRIKSKNIEKLVNKYIFYFLQSNSRLLLKLKKEGGVPAVNKIDLQKFLIPIPPLKKQKEIVTILDKFDTLTNSISEGLPYEIELRKKQYEYYRDMLLTFPKDSDESN